MEQAMIDALLEHQLEDGDLLVGDDEWCVNCEIGADGLCDECEVEVVFPSRDEQ